MANNTDIQIGQWVQPAWTGHAFYGQSGKVIGQGTTGQMPWQIDVNGDGQVDYYLSSTSGQHLSANNTHHKISDDVNGIASLTAGLFDGAAILCLCVVALAVFTHFIRKLKRS